MVRTQIYLTPYQWRHLQHLSKDEGTTVAALIRQAIDTVYPTEEEKKFRFEKVLEGIYGLWADRTDLDDVDAYIQELRQDTRDLRREDEG